MRELLLVRTDPIGAYQSMLFSAFAGACDAVAPLLPAIANDMGCQLHGGLPKLHRKLETTIGRQARCRYVYELECGTCTPGYPLSTEPGDAHSMWSGSVYR